VADGNSCGIRKLRGVHSKFVFGGVAGVIPR
jgi:hypothetical protein